MMWMTLTRASRARIAGMSTFGYVQETLFVTVTDRNNSTRGPHNSESGEGHTWLVAEL